MGYFLFAAQVWSVFAIAVSNIFLGIAILAAPFCASRRRASWVAEQPLLPPLGMFLLFLLASVAASYDPRLSLGGMSDLYGLTPVVLALLFVRNDVDARRIVSGLIILGALLAVAGLLQYLVGTGELDLSKRIRGPMSHYQTFSGMLLLFDVFLITRLAVGRVGTGAVRIGHWLALVLINIALVGSLTRGPWVGLGVALTVLVLVRAPRLLLAYVPTLLLFYLLAPAPVLERLASIFDPRDPSNYDRLCMVYAGAHMVAERPLFGLGPEMVDVRYPIYRHPSAPRYNVPHLHNSFLQLAAERGLLSLGAYLLLNATAMMAAVRAYRREGGLSGPRADLYLSAVLVLVAYNTAGLFEDNWSDTEVQRVAIYALVLPFCRGEAPAPSSRRLSWLGRLRLDLESTLARPLLKEDPSSHPRDAAD